MITITKIDRSLKNEHKNLIKKAVKAVLKDKAPYHINICTCSDEFILEKNNTVLKHNYYTDIITFYYNDRNPLEDADLLISIDRILDNAAINKTTFEKEMSRVIIHGCLHLIGYDDKSDKQKIKMRLMEEKYLDLLFHVEQ